MQSDSSSVSSKNEQGGEQHVGSIWSDRDNEDARGSRAEFVPDNDSRDQYKTLHNVGSEDAEYSSGRPARHDSLGVRIHDRYRLIAELGTGGMGVTYRAWDTQAHVPVVVKMPKREVRRNRGVMSRFAREIEAMRAVPHESIVPITDFGDEDGCPFVVMRFLPGGSLADYRRQDEAGSPIKNPPEMLHFWLPGVAEALDHIHSKGMLHRDIKPGNIFLDGFLKPFVGDFGIAKVVDEAGGLAKEQTLTATKMALGTPEYMAPELFKPRARVDGRSDQYALAVTVYEMLCGKKPFTGGKAHIIVEHSTLPAPSLEKRCPGLPAGVYDAVHRALAKKPEERFSTCSDFAVRVLWELRELPPEPDTVRLLCPECRNVLKLTRKAAGKSGKCPRCQSAMDVAADLGSLWLESEEWGGGDPRSDAASISHVAEKHGADEERSVRLRHIPLDETEKQLLNLETFDISAGTRTGVVVSDVRLGEETYTRLLDFLAKERVFAAGVVPQRDVRSLTASLENNDILITLRGSAAKPEALRETTVVTQKPYSWDEKVLATVFPIFFFIGLGGVALVGVPAIGYLSHLLTELTKMISRTITW
jgi:serine/threonine protein kinase